MRALALEDPRSDPVGVPCDVLRDRSIGVRALLYATELLPDSRDYGLCLSPRAEQLALASAASKFSVGSRDEFVEALRHHAVVPAW